MSLTLKRRPVGNVTIIDASGRITLGDATALLRETINVESEKSRNILLNLANVTYIDSSGLAELLGSYASVRNSGGEIKLLNIHKRIHDLLLMTRLLTIFETFEDEDTAVKSFSSSASA